MGYCIIALRYQRTNIFETKCKTANQKGSVCKKCSSFELSYKCNLNQHCDKTSLVSLAVTLLTHCLHWLPNVKTMESVTKLRSQK